MRGIVPIVHIACMRSGQFSQVKIVQLVVSTFFPTIIGTGGGGARTGQGRSPTCRFTSTTLFATPVSYVLSYDIGRSFSQTAPVVLEQAAL